MKIRQALATDINAWAQLRAVLWPDATEDHKNEINDYFNGSSNHIVMVYLAEIKPEVIGFVELNLRHYAEGSLSHPVPYLEGCYIKPQHQGQGYGKRLIQQAEQWALSKGFSEIASDADMNNHRSIQMHKKLGFKEVDRMVCFLKPLKTS